MYKTNGEIRLASGIHFSVFDPNPKDILITDIAIGLSNACRFGNQVESFYSVAEHSLYVSELVTPELKLAALLHDASEAYLHDLPTPIKERLSEYKALEDNLLKVIAGRFGLDYPFHNDIKEADKYAFEMEHKLLRVNYHSGTSKFECLSPINARDRFLKEFMKLTKD